MSITECCDNHCAIEAKYVMALLGYTTWSVGCKHRTLGMVTICPAAEGVLISLALGEFDVMFRAQGRDVTKISQVHVFTKQDL